MSPIRVLAPPRGIEALPPELQAIVKRHAQWPWEPLDCGDNLHCLERVAAQAFRLGQRYAASMRRKGAA